MKYVTYKDNQGLWRWYLLSANGRKIADSAESYNNKADCIAGINLVKGSANAPITET
jgi:uncharacterized protein YegP (UPF0339 family)